MIAPVGLPMGLSPMGWLPRAGTIAPPVVVAEPTEADIYADIVARLNRAAIFGKVYFGDGPDERGISGERATLAVVVPGTSDDLMGWDDPGGESTCRKCTWTLQVWIREKTPLDRDNRALTLGDAARKALCRKSYAGTTIPGMTYLKSARPDPSVKAPDRRWLMAGEFAYFVNFPDAED